MKNNTNDKNNDAELVIMGEPKNEENGTEAPVKIQKETESVIRQENPPEQEDDVESIKKRYEEELSKVKEKMLRIAADFDNYKKRIQRELGEREERAIGETIKILLPAIDNLQRAMTHLKKANDIKTISDGLLLIEKNFIDSMNKLGIKRFESVGQPFDPSFHEAIGQEPSDEYPAGVVSAEIQCGYTLNDKLLRPALVMVSTGRKTENTDKEIENKKSNGD